MSAPAGWPDDPRNRRPSHSLQGARELNEFTLMIHAKDMATRPLSEKSHYGNERNLTIISEWMNEKCMTFLTIDFEGCADLIHFLYNSGDRGCRSEGRVGNMLTSLASVIELLQLTRRRVDNPIPLARKRYLKAYKSDGGPSVPKQCPPHAVIAEMINSILDYQVKVCHIILAKTGLRRGEFLMLNLEDVNIEENYLIAGPKRKRSNRKICFDSECAAAIRRWLSIRYSYGPSADEVAFMVNSLGRRMGRNTLNRIISKEAIRHGIHDPKAPKDRWDLRFSPQNYRHWFTTNLRKGGCPERIIRVLRGDADISMVDHYDHPTWEEMLHHYLAAMPTFEGSSASGGV